MSNVVPAAVNFAYQCDFWLNRCWGVAIRTITWRWRPRGFSLSAGKSEQMFSISSPSHSSLLRLISPPVLSHSISPCWIRLNLNELYSARESKETYQLLDHLSYITTCDSCLQRKHGQKLMRSLGTLRLASSPDDGKCDCFHARPKSS